MRREWHTEKEISLCETQGWRWSVPTEKIVVKAARHDRESIERTQRPSAKPLTRRACRSSSEDAGAVERAHGAADRRWTSAASMCCRLATSALAAVPASRNVMPQDGSFSTSRSISANAAMSRMISVPPFFSINPAARVRSAPASPLPGGC